MENLNPLMTDKEIDELENSTKRNWTNSSIKEIEQCLRSLTRIKQGTEIKIRVLKELIDERDSDKKSKQYVD